MFCRTHLIRLLRSFGATVEMITLSEVFSILLVMCHHMPPTNCRVSVRGMTTSACQRLLRNMKPLYQAASSQRLNLVFSALGTPSLIWVTFLKNVGDVYCSWRSLIFKGMPCYCTVCSTHSYLVYETSGGVMTVLSASLTPVVLGTHCRERYAVLFCCANSSLCHVCPWCPKIHKE